MTRDPNDPLPDPASIDATSPSIPRRLQVRGRAGIWEVTRDDRFYGHYMGHAAAFAAAEAAALAIVATGGSANIRFKEWQPQPGIAEPAPGSDRAAIGRIRTMEFRPGSTPIVR